MKTQSDKTNKLNSYAMYMYSMHSYRSLDVGEGVTECMIAYGIAARKIPIQICVV